MTSFDNVTVKNALLYAVRAYDNPQCLDTEEFGEDYKHFKYVKRLCRRYVSSGNIAVRLMLNHIVLLNNVFGPSATVRLLFVKCDEGCMYKVLKPFLVYLNLLPDVVYGVNGLDIYTKDIPLDTKLLKKLQEL
jgi:hypothetical protein